MHFGQIGAEFTKINDYMGSVPLPIPWPPIMITMIPGFSWNLEGVGEIADQVVVSYLLAVADDFQQESANQYPVTLLWKQRWPNPELLLFSVVPLGLNSTPS